MENKIDVSLIHSYNDFEGFPKSLQESIKTIMKEEGYVRYSVNKKTIPQDGNFLSSLYEVDIVGETVDGEKVTSLFIKESVTIDKIAIARVSDLYSQEIFVYNDLYTKFVRLQDEAEVPYKERFKLAKTYVSDCGVIVMENLSKKGFKTLNRTQVVPIKFAELSIIELAKFHALSYVVKVQFPAYFENKIKTIKHPYAINNDWETFVRNICAVTGQVLDGEAKSRISNYAPRMIQTYRKHLQDILPSNGCLCHGDYKFLNIMVKELNGEASAVQPIDYQLAYYSSPVNDFLFFIFTGTDREFRRKHLNYLKDLYFEQFSKFLSFFNMDVTSVFSREEFENDYEERIELGLVYGLYVAPFTFAHFDEGFDVSKLSLSELPVVPDELFTDRVKGIVEDYIEWGHL